MRSEGPAARWMAPSTPPPPRREVLAALTMASTRRVVMSAWSREMRELREAEGVGRVEGPRMVGGGVAEGAGGERTEVA